MRNIFDQYSQNENRLTHAFASSLYHDDDLRLAFLVDFLRLSKKQARKIKLTVQAYPGTVSVDAAEAERRGIPDIWFYDDEDWCAVVECKITASISGDQIKRHIRTAAKQFERVLPVLITAHPSATKGADAAIHISWQQIYIWLKQMNPRSAWSRYASDYFEILEQQMIEAEKLTAGTITTFSGFPLSLNEAWSYGEAKRVLQVAMQELRKDVRLAKEMSVDPTLPGRGAITGKGGSAVWDYLRPRQSAGASSHTDHIHVTLGLNAREAEAFVTIPDKIDRSIRRNLIDLGPDGFLHLIKQVTENCSDTLRNQPHAAPILRMVQRRYPSQRAVPFHDAVMTMDLRTAFQADGSVKYQPQWLEAAFAAFADKKSNLQMQIGVIFPLDKCPILQTPQALALLVDGFCACKPVLDVAYSTKL